MPKLLSIERDIQVIVFDLDGVLLDFKKDGGMQRKFETAARVLGWDPSPIKTFVDGYCAGDVHLAGLDTAGLVREFFPQSVAGDVEKFTTEYRAAERAARYYPPVFGASVTLDRLRMRGFRLALMTSNRNSLLKEKLVAANIEPKWFSAMATLDDPHHKPDPRAFHPIIRKTRAGPRDMIMLGDWYPDVRTAHGMGVEFFGVLTGYTPRSVFHAWGVRDDHILESVNALHPYDH